MALSRRTFFAGSVAAMGAGSIAPVRAALGVATPPQTLGPFYPVSKPLDQDADLTHVKGATGRARGSVIDVAGGVLDREGRVVRRALVEIWQCNAFGQYDHPKETRDVPRDPNFQGYGRDVTDGQGGYRFRTIKPPPYPASASWMRPSHIHFRVTAPSSGTLVTQLYFAGDPYLESDFIFNEIADPAARASVVATLAPPPGGLAPPIAAFDIVLA